MYNIFRYSLGPLVPAASFCLFPRAGGIISFRSCWESFFLKVGGRRRAGLPLGREGLRFIFVRRHRFGLASGWFACQSRVKELLPVGARLRWPAEVKLRRGGGAVCMEEVVGDLHAAGAWVGGAAEEKSWGVLRLRLGTKPLFPGPQYTVGGNVGG